MGGGSIRVGNKLNYTLHIHVVKVSYEEPTLKETWPTPIFLYVLLYISASLPVPCGGNYREKDQSAKGIAIP